MIWLLFTCEPRGDLYTDGSFYVLYSVVGEVGIVCDRPRWMMDHLMECRF